MKGAVFAYKFAGEHHQFAFSMVRSMGISGSLKVNFVSCLQNKLRKAKYLRRARLSLFSCIMHRQQSEKLGKGFVTMETTKKYSNQEKNQIFVRRNYSEAENLC